MRSKNYQHSDKPSSLSMIVSSYFEFFALNIEATILSLNLQTLRQSYFLHNVFDRILSKLS
jgi:hypothetical protein